MKNLKRIIILFLLILITGIVIAYFNVTSSLSRGNSSVLQQTVKNYQDTKYLLEAEKPFV